MHLLAWLLLLSFGGTASSALAQAPVTPADARPIFGTITDASSSPIADAEISLAGADSTVHRARSAADGSFSLGRHHPGGAALRVRRLGFAPLAVAVQILRDTAPAFVPVVLAAVAVDLAPVRVLSNVGDVNNVAIRLRSFERLRRDGRFGYFIDREEFARRSASDASELIRRVPGAALRPSGRIGNLVRLRGCRPIVRLDNVSLPGSEVDEVVRSSDLAGMAVYPSWGTLPARYMDRRAGNCGAVLIWTR